MTFEKISNGWLATSPEGIRTHCPAISDMMSLLISPLQQELEELRHFQWSGKFHASMSFRIESDAALNEPNPKRPKS